MSEELKPCGSCGCDAAEMCTSELATFWVECSACGSQAMLHPTEADAIAAWNRRPIEDKLQDRIDALEWLREVEAMREALQPTWWANRKVTIGEDAYKASRLEFLDTEDNANIEVNTALAAAREAVEVGNE